MLTRPNEFLIRPNNLLVRPNKLIIRSKFTNLSDRISVSCEKIGNSSERIYISSEQISNSERITKLSEQFANSSEQLAISSERIIYFYLAFLHRRKRARAYQRAIKKLRITDTLQMCVLNNYQLVGSFFQKEIICLERYGFSFVNLPSHFIVVVDAGSKM